MDGLWITRNKYVFDHKIMLNYPGKNTWGTQGRVSKEKTTLGLQRRLAGSNRRRKYILQRYTGTLNSSEGVHTSSYME